MKPQTTLLLLLAFMTACSKKDKNQSRTELLTTGNWKITTSENDDDANGTYETDNYALFDDCFKDNIFTFKTGGQLDLDEGPSKCDPLDPQTETVPWQLTNNDNTLVVDGESYDILELNNSTLRFKENLTAGRSSRVTFTKR